MHSFWWFLSSRSDSTQISRCKGSSNPSPTDTTAAPIVVTLDYHYLGETVSCSFQPRSVTFLLGARLTDFFSPATHSATHTLTSPTCPARKPYTMRSTKFVAATLALAGTPVSAFWRMECRGVSGQARLDPLVAYGKVGSGHVHEIFGSSGRLLLLVSISAKANIPVLYAGFSDVADYDTLTAGNCTSCAVTADKSAYWTPIPYFRDNETGEYEAVNNVGGMLA